MGNLIRYPSQVYNNYGLQWFIPYLMTVCLIAIPVLILEIAIGQAYRGGSVVAYNTMHHRLKGTGLNLIYVGFVVGPYFAVNLGQLFPFLPSSNSYHDSNTYAVYSLDHGLLQEILQLPVALEWRRCRLFHVQRGGVQGSHTTRGRRQRYWIRPISRHRNDRRDSGLDDLHLVSCLDLHFQRCWSNWSCRLLDHGPPYCCYHRPSRSITLPRQRW